MREKDKWCTGRWNNLARLDDMIRVQFGEDGGHEKMAGELRDESVQKILLLVTD